MNSLFQHEIPKRNQCCAQHGERFSPGSEIYSLLYEEPTEKLARQDFCSVCWKEIQKKIDLPAKRTYWKSKLEIKPPTPPSNRIQKALILLKELRNSPESHEEELFVLCLFLSHAKQLVMRKEIKKENQLYYLYELLGQEDYLTIKVFNFTKSHIQTLQQSIALKLLEKP